MEFLKTLLAQEPEVFVPFMIGAVVVLHWVLRLVMTLVKVGVALGAIAAVCAYLPYV